MLEPDVHQPLQHIELPAGYHIWEAVFSPDGETVHALVTSPAVNVWTLLVYFWPEVLGAVALLTAVVCVPMLWRILARRRIVGEPHCRKCNYCLRGVGERCPECGASTARPVIGRATWRRTLPFALPLAVVVLGYGALWAIQLPRSGPASSWLHWWSEDLAPWAAKYKVSLKQWETEWRRWIAFGVKSGVRRPSQIKTRVNHVYDVTPDGRFAIVSTGWTKRDARVLAIDIGTGEVIGAVAPVELSPQPTSDPNSYWVHDCLGFAADNRTAYLEVIALKDYQASLGAWNVSSSEIRVIGDLGRDAVRRVTQSGLPMPKLWLVPSSASLRYLTDERKHAAREHNLRLHETSTGVVIRTFELPELVYGIAMTKTGRFAYFDRSAQRDLGIQLSGVAQAARGQFWRLDLQTEEVTSVLPLRDPYEYSSVDLCEPSSIGRLLIARATRMKGSWIQFSVTAAFLVGDLATEQWIGYFACPEALEEGAQRTRLSADARRMAVWCEYSRTKSQPEKRHLVIYDLTTLPHADIDLNPAPAGE